MLTVVEARFSSGAVAIRYVNPFLPRDAMHPRY